MQEKFKQVVIYAGALTSPSREQRVSGVEITNTISIGMKNIGYEPPITFPSNLVCSLRSPARFHECEQFPRRREVLVAVVLQLDAASATDVSASPLRGAKFSHSDENPTEQHTHRELLRSYGHREGKRWNRIIGQTNTVS